MTIHELSEPERMSYPGGKDGMHRVRCSCGYITSPRAYPGHAERDAEAHKRDKEAGLVDGEDQGKGARARGRNE